MKLKPKQIIWLFMDLIFFSSMLVWAFTPDVTDLVDMGLPIFEGIPTIAYVYWRYKK